MIIYKSKIKLEYLGGFLGVFLIVVWYLDGVVVIGEFS